MTLHSTMAADLPLSFEVLDRLMPMHVALDREGCVRHLGPTIAKMMLPDEGDAAHGLIGARLLDLVEVRRPAGTGDYPALMRQAGLRLSLVLMGAQHLPLRGVIMPLSDGSGAILDISLGLSFVRAVGDFSLTLPDFSPCDQTVELLYLHEANISTARLSRHLSQRLQAAHASAHVQARTDALTGLSNRRAIDDELEELLSMRQHNFSLMHLDLDLFKEVNDTHGHAAGDAVLIEVGQILGRELRQSDFPARVGGDEFLIILRPALTPKIVGHVATRLIKRIERPVRFEAVGCQVSASIGIVSTEQYCERPSVERMMADVDAALYQAKNDGRGRYVVLGGGAMLDEARQ